MYLKSEWHKIYRFAWSWGWDIFSWNHLCTYKKIFRQDNKKGRNRQKNPFFLFCSFFSDSLKYCFSFSQMHFVDLEFFYYWYSGCQTILREINLALKSQKLREIMVDLSLKNCVVIFTKYFTNEIREQFHVFPQCVTCDLMKN